MASSSSSPPTTPRSALANSHPIMPSYQHPYYYTASSYVAAIRDYSPMDQEDCAQDAPYWLASESPRSTFFMVSAERGRWKTDPLPRKFYSKPRVRENKCETPVSDAADSTLPALDTDRDSSLGPAPSSPFPPSSPPLSPISHASSPLPFSSLLSSPISSPILETLPLEEDSAQGEMVSTLINATRAPRLIRSRCLFMKRSNWGGRILTPTWSWIHFQSLKLTSPRWLF